MSSQNPHFTFHYSQPEEYRFSHDSVFLAREVFELIPKDRRGLKGLDLCSGCGIVGLDFLFHLRESQSPLFQQFDFMEVQDIYGPHFEVNCHRFGEGLPKTTLLLKNYETLSSAEFHQHYDLVLSNPPYFRLGQGKMSPSEFKNRCRFFIDSNFENLVLGIDNTLKPGGRAFILLRDLQDHGWSPLKEAQRLLSGRREITVVGDVRGTPVIQIS